MKKNIFLFTTLLLFFCLEIPPSLADDVIVEPAHSGPETNFKKISQSTVIISTQFGYGTGTMVKYKKRKLVITAKHVVSSAFGETVVATISKGDVNVPAKIIYNHPEKDISILEVSEPMGIEYFDLDFSRKEHSVGDSTGYCGHPNRTDLSCFAGRISGFSNGYVNIHTYAFSGASGSLVVDKKGRAIGVLSAIEVGTFYGVPTPP